MPHTTPQVAGRDQTPPALMPLPEESSPVPFWAVEALNCDAEAIAVDALYKRVRRAEDYTTCIALLSARRLLQEQATKAVENAVADGHLLFCWRGSKALSEDQALDRGIDAAAEAAGVVVL